MKTALPAHCAQWRDQARAALSQGDPGRAEHLFAQVLAEMPTDVEALQFMAARRLSQDRKTDALELLATASRTRPDDPSILHQLGVVRSLLGDAAGAIEAFRRALSLAPGLFFVRLRLAVALEQSGQYHEALVAYFAAVNQAQAKGRWLSDATTDPSLREAVKHAMRYVNAGRHDLFHRVLEPLRERYGPSEMTRVEHALAIYLGEQRADLPDPRQQPKFFYFPDVPSQPYYPRERFPWLDALEAATDSIRAELTDVLGNGQSLEAFLGEQSPEQLQAMLRSSGQQDAAWDAFFFHRHGERYDEHCARCPQTTALLDTLPLVRIRDHAPEALFSVLRPGTHILPHRGVTNTRLVTHLPLIVPPDCALRVGGQTHAWREGECVTFDDTFEHEAWNRSTQTRVVLILDVWNPDLSEAERSAVADLVEAIGDFNRQCELPADVP